MWKNKRKGSDESEEDKESYNKPIASRKRQSNAIPINYLDKFDTGTNPVTFFRALNHSPYVII